MRSPSSLIRTSDQVSTTLDCGIGAPASAISDNARATTPKYVVPKESQDIARKLGGDEVGDLCDSEYSNLIIISIPRAKATQMLVERYLAPQIGRAAGEIPEKGSDRTDSSEDGNTIKGSLTMGEMGEGTFTGKRK